MLTAISVPSEHIAVSNIISSGTLQLLNLSDATRAIGLAMHPSIKNIRKSTTRPRYSSNAITYSERESALYVRGVGITLLTAK